MSYNEHEFYCLKCGNKGIPLSRNPGFKRKSMHRKKLYCIYCKEEVNHVECTNRKEVEQFKKDFENGVYANEAEESLAFVRSAGQWKKHLGTTANCH